VSIVRHKTYGKGLVKTIYNGYIEIDFGGQLKRFKFPEAFEKFLLTEDVNLLQILAETKEKAIQEEKAVNEKKSVISPPIKIRTISADLGLYNCRSMHNIHNSLLGERAQTIVVCSEEEMFELVGYMASPNRISSVEAEVPKDGRDEVFERVFPGQTFRPIELGDTPSGLPKKMGPQFRINFSNLSNCPDTLLRNMGKGVGSCIGRINRSKFVIDLVQNYGFRFGNRQDVLHIRSIAKERGYIEAFERGYKR